jgi:Flp pilus assembly protein TadG
LAVLSLTLLVSMVALVVDGGCLMEERRHAQATADAAALAAAADLYTNYGTNGGADPKGTAAASAQATASANGFTNDGVQSVVTVNVSPQNYQGGPNAGSALPPGYVEVIVQYNASRTFSGVFGPGTVPVRARAVARGRWVPASNNATVLNLNNSSVLSIAALSGLKVNGKLLVNSNSSSGINLGLLASLSAAEFDLNNAVQGLIGLLLSLLKGLLGGSPSVQYMPPIADPLRYVSDPDPVKLGLSAQTNGTITGGVKDLYPGVYSGGINISGGATVTLHANADGTPGIYYLQGGGFKVSGAANTVTTSAAETAGVMIYNDWSGSSDAIGLNVDASLTLTPPSKGAFKGITIFQKRGTPNNPAPSITIAANGTANVGGTIYGAYAQITLSSKSGSNVLGGQVIGDSVNVSGGTVNIDPGTHPIANARAVGLVE